MTSILDTDPDLKAYAFSHRFQVGHALRATRTSELRIEREHVFEEVRLFLDAGELIEGVEAAAESLDANVAFRAEDITSGDVRAIGVVEWRSRPGSVAVRTMTALSGLTVSIPAGTEFGISASQREPAGQPLKIRFPRDTDIEVGVSRDAMLEHRVHGLRPVLLGGIPLLEVTAHDVASVRLQMRTSKTAILTLFGVVSPYRRRGVGALVHIMEAVGGRVIGGTSIRVRV